MLGSLRQETIVLSGNVDRSSLPSVSPLLQPLPYHCPVCHQLRCHLAELLTQPLSSLLTEHPAAGHRPQGQADPGSRPAFLGWGCDCQPFLSVPAVPPLSPPCPSAPPGLSTHHLPAPFWEIATIHHDQQSPSSPTGRAINLRSPVAPGFWERNRGSCVQGPRGAACSCLPWACTLTPPHPLPTPGLTILELNRRDSCRRVGCRDSSKHSLPALGAAL